MLFPSRNDEKLNKTVPSSTMEEKNRNEEEVSEEQKVDEEQKVGKEQKVDE